MICVGHERPGTAREMQWCFSSDGRPDFFSAHATALTPSMELDEPDTTIILGLIKLQVGVIFILE
jgi:hypothetical protein